MMDLRKKTYILDGAMGTMLQRAGMGPDDDPNDYLRAHPDVVESIHRSYAEAGSDIIYAPTFNINRKLSEKLGDGLDEYVKDVMAPALAVKKEMAGKGKELLVAVDIGPLGELLEPLGYLAFEDAYEAFRKLVVAGTKAGADLIVIETMTDLYEVKAAVLAAKENSDLPIIVSMSFEENGRTFTGTGLEAMAVMLEGLGVDAMGINCSLGPAQILPLIKELKSHTTLPVFAKPNAGLPDPATGEYDISPDRFAEIMKQYIDAGISMAGGCCGTDPEYIRGIAEYAAAAETRCNEGNTEDKASVTRVSGRSTVVTLDHVVVVGERINPSGKPKLKQTLKSGDMEYVLRLAIEQEDAGAEILDVNVGAPGVDELAVMPKVVKAIQAVSDLPIQIDSSRPDVIEAALRVCNGKAVINSMTGEERVMEKILPLARKYGACVIGLTMDEDGIPETAEGRYAVAEKVLKKAKEYGIPEEDVIIDCLTLTASAQQKGTDDTLEALRMVKERLGVPTTLGISNVSFGLPRRSLLNGTFLIMALANGLDLPIIDPNDEALMEQIRAFDVLKNLDPNGRKFAERYGEKQEEDAPEEIPVEADTAIDEPAQESRETNDIFDSIENGLASETASAVRKLLETEEPMTIIENYLVPALDNVGKQFEDDTLYLPQLLQAATAAQAGFKIINDRIAEEGGSRNLGDLMVATVKGDIHDIGKNIAAVIMKNYGFNVIDLGKDVSPEDIVASIKENNIRLVGLSALMTTTLVSMKDTIELIRKEAPWCKVMVGGAVLTEEYAKSIDADDFCGDAMKSVDTARQVFQLKQHGGTE